MEFNNYLITAANSYLGQAFVQQLAKSETNKLLLVTRKDFDFSSLNSDNILHIKGIDLLSEKDLKHLQEQCKKFFSGKFNVINCTGYYKGQEPFTTTLFTESEKIFNSNFTTVLAMATYFIPLMVEKGGGHFIGFSCKSVQYNYPEMAPYTAAKTALESLIRSLANEFYEKGIYANAFQLATLFTDHEVAVKPHGDHKNWLKTDEVAICVESFINQPIHLTNGNSIGLYHYSHSFFNESYYARIK